MVGATIDGERISELSGLAWDVDEQRLYAISDRGVLFRLKLTLGASGPREVEPIAACRLAAPQQGERADHHRVVAADRSWSFPRYPAHNARLKGMDVMDDGRLLVLERTESGKGKGKTTVVAPREVDLAACPGAQACPVRELAVLDRADEAENFEGLTDLGDGRVMIVSDDRGKSVLGTTFTVLQRSLAADRDPQQ